jgi:hypothetical protein
MYVYSRTTPTYSSYGLSLRKIKRLQNRLQRQLDRAEEKLEKERASEVEKNLQSKPVKPQSANSIRSNLLGDLMFNPGGAATGTFVDIISNGVKKGGTGTFLDIIGSGDTGGVGMLDILGSTSGGNLLNIVTGMTMGSIVKTSAVSDKIVDPFTQKVQSIIVMSQLGAALDVSA